MRKFIALATGFAVLLTTAMAFGERASNSVSPFWMIFLLLPSIVVHEYFAAKMKFCVCGELVSHPIWKMDPDYCPHCQRIQASGIDNLRQLCGSSATVDLNRLQERSPEMPVLKIVAMGMLLAVRDSARRVIFEPQIDKNVLLYETDHSVHRLIPPPRHLDRAISDVIKVLFRMNTERDQIVQNGRFRVRAFDREVLLTAVIEPCQFGEKFSVEIVDA